MIDPFVVGAGKRLFRDGKQVYLGKPAMILTITEDLKGKLPFRKLPINLRATTKDAKEGKHVPLLLKRLAHDVPLVIFVRQRDEETFNAFAFTNGTWLQILGRKPDDGPATWRFLNCEPYLRGTFKGTTEELTLGGVRTRRGRDDAKSRERGAARRRRPARADRPRRA